MSIILFDCSQFILLELYENVTFEERSKLSNIFNDVGFNINFEKNISEIKKEYLCSNYVTENINYIIELEDEEFVGEFEDWKEKDKIPIRIKKFIDKVNILINYSFVKYIKIIFIDYVSENNDENAIFNKKLNPKNMINSFYELSKWNFDNSANINILFFEV